MAIYKFNCENCKFKCKFNSAWLIHLTSEKHLREGQNKIHKCLTQNCEYTTETYWNMKMHHMTMHSTKEERMLSKYYCKDCDKVFFAPLYLDKHNNGIKHKNQIKINTL
jgi:hypothetical protein